MSFITIHFYLKKPLLLKGRLLYKEKIYREKSIKMQHTQNTTEKQFEVQLDHYYTPVFDIHFL